ncbi:SPOR domain-containing protein [Hyphococcus sp. DH-69]|uniref:SPOR domain-containing protein n=1 Tax=Hyphococcus formosus TaxID=3143534 RepID=UPI00398A52FE
MTNAAQDETYDEDYQEYDEFDDDDDRGLSGLVVLIMGIVMIGAFVSVVWISYNQGVKAGREGGIAEMPYVAADPEPIKIETADSGEEVADREVYDALDGNDPEPVTTLAEGPEEPVTRNVDDTIGALAAEAEGAAADISDEVEDRLASLKEEDAATLGPEAVPSQKPRNEAPETVSVTPTTPASTTPASNVRPASRASGSARSGSHVVQVGAFRSNDEAMAQWSRLEGKLGGYLDGKSPDVERADLGDRGVYHRLRIGPFSSSDAAKTYCAGLKERGQDCLIKAL